MSCIFGFEKISFVKFGLEKIGIVKFGSVKIGSGKKETRSRKSEPS